MKAQSSLLILAIIVSFVVIILVYNLFVEFGTEKRMTYSILLEILSKYSDFLKGYSKSSFILSSHLSIKKIAAKGGVVSDVQPRTYICNSPIPPEPVEVRFWLEKETLEALNSYSKNVNVKKDVVFLNISNFSCVNYKAEDSKIFSGFYDEGFFTISAEGSKINVSTLDFKNSVSSINNLELVLPQVRFWYLYRNFYDWANEESNNLLQAVCGCIEYICGCPQAGACGTCPNLLSCINNALNESMKALQSRFDEYVECSYSMPCCEYESQPCPNSTENYCLGWNTDKCHGCLMPPFGTSCSVSFSEYHESFKTEPGYSRIMLKQMTQEECEEKSCYYWQENREVLFSIFQCTDNKYFLSLPGKTGPINFAVSVWIALRKPYSCPSSTTCELTATSECVCKSGIWCTGCI